MLNRKIISIILAMLLTLMCCTGLTFAETGSYAADTDSFAVKVAQGLGAIGDYDAEKKVTVADFKKAVDALATTPGLSKLYFRSSTADAQEIKCIDAAAVMCDILGYGVFYASKGYGETKTEDMLLTATKYGILDGVSEKKDETLTMKSLVNMLYNVLDAKTLDTSYSSNGGYQASVTDRRYIEDVMNMAFISGVVERTRFSSLKSENGTDDNVIEIGGVSYDCNIADFDKYIGMKVKALVSYNNDEKEVLALFDNGKSFEIAADDLDFSEITKTKLVYFNKSDKRVTLSVSEKADVLYNFSLLKEWTADDLKVKQGRLVCIDNDGDGTYDVIKIEEYKSMVVFSASVDSEKISNSSGVAVSIKNLIEKGYPIYDGEKAISPENIPTGAVATYFLNKSGEVMRIYLHNDIAAGVIKRIDATNNKIKLDDREYSYTDEIEEDIEKLSLGTSITVNINVFGEIAYYQIAKDAYLYGYMMSFSDDNGFGDVKVKIFTQGNEFKVYKTAGKVNLNGSSMSAQKAFEYNLNTGLWDEAGKINQIIKYKVNSKDELTAIRTATNYYDAAHPERLLKEKDGVYTYYSDSKTITGDTRLNVLTKVFIIPSDLTETTRFKYGGMEVMYGENINCQVYDIDEDRYADVVVARVNAYGAPQINDIGNTPYLVETVGETTNSRGDRTAYVECHPIGASDPKTVEMVFNRPDISRIYSGEQIMPESLKKGDIIMVANDYTMSWEKGNFSMWCRPGLTKPYEATKQYWKGVATETEFWADARILAFGEVIKAVKDGLIINNKPRDTENYDEWNRIVTVNGKTSVYICDKEKDRVVKASIADVQPGDKVFSVLSSAITPTELVIYRNFE